MADSGRLTVRLGIVEGRTHLLYEEFLRAPPEGVTYVADGIASPDAPAPKKRPIAFTLKRSGAVRAVTDRVFVRALPKPGKAPGGLSYALSKAMMRVAGGKSTADKDSRGFDVFHSAGHSMIENIPWILENNVQWVVDFEHSASLFGYYGDWRRRIYRKGAQRILEKQLSSSYCRKLLPWTEAGRSSLQNLIPSKELEAKTEVLRLSIRPAPPRPKDIEKHDSVRILFVGSANFQGEFWSKGGYEVLESYRLLRERFGDKVELVFRCWMPDELKAKYGSLAGIRTACDLLPRDEFDRLFWGSDIFLFPAHNSPGLAFLDGMRFGLPVVGKDIWANRETVEDGVSGYLVKPSERVPYTLPGNVPNWGGDDTDFLEFMKVRDERVINDLVERLSRLVESESLRKKMGAAGRKEVEEGRASITKRNAALRRIYEEAAKR
jgi:glycosyltransferase involved in cell wall biosynthesis